jgi:hypothetical protein
MLWPHWPGIQAIASDTSVNISSLKTLNLADAKGIADHVVASAIGQSSLLKPFAS